MALASREIRVSIAFSVLNLFKVKDFCEVLRKRDKNHYFWWRREWGRPNKAIWEPISYWFGMHSGCCDVLAQIWKVNSFSLEKKSNSIFLFFEKWLKIAIFGCGGSGADQIKHFGSHFLIDLLCTLVVVMYRHKSRKLTLTALRKIQIRFFLFFEKWLKIAIFGCGGSGADQIKHFGNLYPIDLLCTVVVVMYRHKSG